LQHSLSAVTLGIYLGGDTWGWRRESHDDNSAEEIRWQKYNSSMKSVLNIMHSISISSS